MQEVASLHASHQNVPSLTSRGGALPTLRRGLAPMNLRPLLGVSKMGASKAIEEVRDCSPCTKQPLHQGWACCRNYCDPPLPLLMPHIASCTWNHALTIIARLSSSCGSPCRGNKILVACCVTRAPLSSLTPSDSKILSELEPGCDLPGATVAGVRTSLRKRSRVACLTVVPPLLLGPCQRDTQESVQRRAIQSQR